MKKGRIISCLFILWVIVQSNSLIAQHAITGTFPEIRNAASNYLLSKNGTQFNFSETMPSDKILLVPVVFDQEDGVSENSFNLNPSNGNFTVSGEIGLQNIAKQIVHVSIHNPSNPIDDAAEILFEIDLDQQHSFAYFSFGLNQRPDSLLFRIEFQGDPIEINEVPALFLENIRLQIEPSHQALPIKIYPNPASQRLTIEFQPFENSREIAIFNMLGNCVKLSVLHSPESLLQINISDLPEGYYIVVVKSDKQQIFSDRIIIERN